MKTTIVNIRHDNNWDIYIGRGRCPRTGVLSKWGNPYSHLETATLAKFRVSTREEAIEAYETWILTQPKLLKDLHELKGKVLGCWCAPKPCHGSVLLKLIEKYE